MARKIVLRDFENNLVYYTIANFEDVREIQINVISGDEVATIFYENGERALFDSSYSRMDNHDHDEFLIYSKPQKKDCIEGFNVRRTSYSDFEGKIKIDWRY